MAAALCWLGINQVAVAEKKAFVTEIPGCEGRLAILGRNQFRCLSKERYLETEMTVICYQKLRCIGKPRLIFLSHTQLH